jgi:outer membrane protein TolC
VADLVAAEVTRAYYQAEYQKRQVDAAREHVRAAAEAVPLNFKGILGGDLRAIEGQQAIGALAYARGQYLTALIDHNRAQFSLLRALGHAPDSGQHQEGSPCAP